MRKQPPFDGMFPVLSDWFARTFGEPTDIQRRAWDAISSGSHALIAAPTGSGKTLASLLPCLDRLLWEKSEGAAGKGVKIVYITPLKALNNDIHHHVFGFVEQIERLAEETGQPWPGIRSAVRTGDTKPAERASMLRRPPDIMVTTPESLYLLLTSGKGREMLHTVRQVIVDEIHNLAADKRGTHLSLSLERLQELCGAGVQRIGVSATQKPLERVARFLGGWEDEPAVGDDGLLREAEPSEEGFIHPLGYRPRPVRIVESDIVKRYSVQATIPDQSRPVQTREAVWLPLLDRLLQLMEGSRSVLIYVNSRRLCERLCLRLNDHVGYEMARAHHGSMSREWRLEVEKMLKSGELRCIVATASLELGIDVGHVDFVIQIDPPPEAAAGIQRVGRAGHSVGDTSRGAIVARHKGALPDIAVLSRLISERDIEEIRIPRDTLDVLSQQTVAMAAEQDWTVNRLYRLIVRCDSYRAFPRNRLESLLELQSGFYPFLRPLLDWDRDTGNVTGRSNSAMAAIMGAGTIPQSSSYPVHHAESRAHIGELDEEFIQETKVGDVVQLGSQPWMIREIRQDRVYATEAGNRFSEIPFWRNEAMSRSYELGKKIGIFLGELENRLDRPDGETISWLESGYGMDAHTAGELIGYVRSQQAVSRVPTDRRIVVEHYRDVANQKHVIIHNHFGKKVNRTWLLAIERQFENALPYRVYGNAKDNGIELVFAEWDVSWLHVIWQVTSANAEALLAEALAGSPLLAVAFRRIAETSLLLSRSFSRVPLWQKRLRGAELLKNALPYAERFPYFQEAMREAMHDYLDIDRLRDILESVADGRIETVVRETEFPSPMAAQFIFDYVNMRIYEGDGLDESVQLQLLQFSKSFAGDVFGPGVGLKPVDPEIMEEEGRRLSEPERAVRNAEELLRLLKERGDLTEDEIIRIGGPETSEWLRELRSRRRVAQIRWNGTGVDHWIAADEREIYASFPQTQESVAFVIGRYAANRLSFTENELRQRYTSVDLKTAESAVESLLKQGVIEQAPFAADPDERIWSGRDVAARLIRLSIGKARRSVEPVDASRWLGHLLQRQLVLTGNERRGGEGLLDVIERLQGLFLPLSHWESIIFPSRLSDYRKENLDLLCASGQILWIGRKDGDDKEGKIAFFLSEQRALYEPCLLNVEERNTQHPELLDRLRTGGARFLIRLSQETGRLPSELLPHLLDLVWEGHVSNDQFAPLRLSARSKGKDGFLKAGSGLGRWYWTGSLLATDAAVAQGGDLAEPATPEEQPVVRWVHHLLETYGLLTKDIAAQTSPYAWESLMPVLKKLEEWGAVTRGMFIRDLHVLQFTTRELAETIRKPAPAGDSSGVTLLSSVDPANPYGIIVDWPSEASAAFSRKPGNYLVLQGNRWLFWIENNGKRIYSMTDAASGVEQMGDLSEQVLKTAFSLLLSRRGLSKITVEQWNGAEILKSQAGEALRALGAERDRDSLVLWPSQLH
ncbi:MAG: box helicase domain protein [Cohnella sp.]|nr:box helicase domain protein [Cohnella sp.]